MTAGGMMMVRCTMTQDTKTKLHPATAPKSKLVLFHRAQVFIRHAALKGGLSKGVSLPPGDPVTNDPASPSIIDKPVPADLSFFVV